MICILYLPSMTWCLKTLPFKKKKSETETWHKWNHIVCVLLCQASFTQHVFEIYPYCCMCHGPYLFISEQCFITWMCQSLVSSSVLSSLILPCKLTESQNHRASGCGRSVLTNLIPPHPYTTYWFSVIGTLPMKQLPNPCSHTSSDLPLEGSFFCPCPALPVGKLLFIFSLYLPP